MLRLPAAAQFTFLQDDVGVPKNYRHMEGFGVHTYTLVGKSGKVTYVKFHWQPACGARRPLPCPLYFTQCHLSRAHATCWRVS